MRGLFVTGTDTGVGKTRVGAALLRLALRRGRRPRPFKPVETGCAARPEDANLLWLAAGRPIPLEIVCPFAFPLPAAPDAAARAAGVTLVLSDLARLARVAAESGDFLLVEGAGGLLAPYTRDGTVADLAALLDLPILVVARTALGTINHSALTLAELSRRCLPLAGLVLAQTATAPEPHEQWNPPLIEAVSGVRPLGTLAHLNTRAASDPDALADALEVALGRPTIDRLLGPA